jgi:hypothetical protein
MRIKVGVPKFGFVAYHLADDARLAVESRYAEFEIEELSSADAAKVLTIRPAPGKDEVSFFVIGDMSYRSLDAVVKDGETYDLQLGLGCPEQHPLFREAVDGIAALMEPYRGKGVTELMSRLHPKEFALAFAKDSSDPYKVTILPKSRWSWAGGPDEAQRTLRHKAFCDRIGRMVAVDGVLMVREGLPMLRLEGDIDYPVLRVVWSEPTNSIVGMNRSHGFAPTSFGYFGAEEYEAALDFAARLGGGWLSEQEVEVVYCSGTVPTRRYADLSLVDLAEGMRKRFVRRIAPLSHHPEQSFAEMEEALAEIDVETFEHFRKLVDGIAAFDGSRLPAALVEVIPAILSSANARKVFFTSERVAGFADMALSRWDNSPFTDLADLKAA